MARSHKIGDMYVTRNTDEVGNPTPGYWNHCAMYVGKGQVVEAQIKHGVIKVSLNSFRRRYPEYRRLRYKGDARIAERAARGALDSVGLPYKKIASIFRHLRKRTRGENCVSVMRRCWKNAFRRVRRPDPRWKKPDHVAASHMFFKVEHHRDYKNWRKPDEFI